LKRAGGQDGDHPCWFFIGWCFFRRCLIFLHKPLWSHRLYSKMKVDMLQLTINLQPTLWFKKLLCFEVILTWNWFGIWISLKIYKLYIDGKTKIFRLLTTWYTADVLIVSLRKQCTVIHYEHGGMFIMLFCLHNLSKFGLHISSITFCIYVFFTPHNTTAQKFCVTYTNCHR
jgi:hypothetical protein